MRHKPQLHRITIASLLFCMTADASPFDSLRILASKNRPMELYRGPSRSSKLPSFILTSKPLHAASGERYFSGSPKPLWDSPMEFHTIECGPGGACSQTIDYDPVTPRPSSTSLERPLYDLERPRDEEPRPFNSVIEDRFYADVKAPVVERYSEDREQKENRYKEEKFQEYNRYQQDKKSQKYNRYQKEEKFPSLLTSASNILGPSVASVYGVPNQNLLRSPQTKTTTVRPQNVIRNDQTRYDPFAFHDNAKPRTRTASTRVTPAPAHYMDSRFSGRILST